MKLVTGLRAVSVPYVHMSPDKINIYEIHRHSVRITGHGARVIPIQSIELNCLLIPHDIHGVESNFRCNRFQLLYYLVLFSTIAVAP